MKKFIVKTPDPRGGTSQVTLCVLVMDAGEFEELVCTIEKIDNGNFFDSSGKLVSDSSGVIGGIRNAKILPMVARGTKTEFLFEKYKIDEKFFSAIVRGVGTQLIEKLSESVRTSMSMRSNALNN